MFNVVTEYLPIPQTCEVEGLAYSDLAGNLGQNKQRQLGLSTNRHFAYAQCFNKKSS